MASRRPRMPRVPGAQRAQAEAAKAKAEAAQAASEDATADAPRDGGSPDQGGEVVEMRRAADAADASVTEDAEAGASPSARIAREPDPHVSTLRPAARTAGSRPAGTARAAGTTRTAGSRPTGTRPGGAPQRRLGPSRTAEQAAQDAARRRQPPPKPVPARSVTGRSLVVIAVIFIAATLMAPTLRVYLNQSLEISAAQEDIADQQRKKAEYEDRIDRWEDPEFVKQQARDRLDLVMPGETLYMVTGKDRLEKAPEETATTQEEPVNEHLPWAEGLWDSVVRAATE